MPPLNTKQSTGKSMPAFTLYDVGVKEISGILNQRYRSGEFSISFLRPSVLSLKVRGLNIYEEVRTLLTERGYKFHTHTPRSLLPYMLVIENLSDEFSSDEVKDFFRNKVLFPVEIIGLNSISPSKWLLRVTKNSDIASLYKLNRILDCDIKIKKDKGRDFIICFNCQRPGHISSNCTMPPRCNKCLENHPSYKCPIPSKGKEVMVENIDPVSGKISQQPPQPVSCVNCKVVGHTASSRTCPRRLAILARKAQNRAETQAKAVARSQRLASTQAEISFSQALRSNLKPSVPNSRPTKNPSMPAPTNSPTVTNHNNIVHFFSTDFNIKCEKAKTFGPIFKKIQANAGLDAAMSAWLLFIAGDVQF